VTVPAAPPVSQAAAAPEVAGPPVCCANCGAPITGRYCSACGQRVEDSVHSLRFFLGEALEDLTHADSRLWRTLTALFMRPGDLTCEFLSGRRARYLPPVRLYLVLSVAFFLLASLAPSVGVVVISMDDSGKSVRVQSSTLDQAIAGLSKPSETDQQRAERVCKSLNIEAPLRVLLGPQRLAATCRRVVLDSGRSLTEAIVHNVPRAMFLFLPLIALVMKLLYLRPRRYYVEHLLFLLHNHSFVFLLFGLLGVLRFLPIDGARAVLFLAAMLYTIGYLYRAMRRVYGESRLSTALKYVLLSLTYAVSAVLMFGLTFVYSALTLVPGP